jgi:hypothetical protein
VHRPTASAPLPDSYSFFQQRPMSVYNTPVQDCLWVAGLLMNSCSYRFTVLHVKVDTMSRNKKIIIILLGVEISPTTKQIKFSMEENSYMRSLFLTLEMITFSS